MTAASRTAIPGPRSAAGGRAPVQASTHTSGPVSDAHSGAQRPCSASRHDTASAYVNDQCRCPTAREQWRLRSKRARQGRPEVRLVPAWRVQRRLHALAAIGWPLHEVAARLGWSVDKCKHLSHGRVRRVYVATDAAVAGVYDRLARRPGPSVLAGKAAATRGWVPPCGWVDIDDPREQPGGYRVCCVRRCPGPLAVAGLCRTHAAAANVRGWIR